MNLLAAPAHPSNFSDRPADARIRAVIYHDTQGTVDSAVAWFQRAEAQVSAHYLVAADGRVYSCVPEVKKAWHAGSSVLFGFPDLNAWSIGIELEDRDDRLEYPKAQMDGLLELAEDIAARYRIPLNHHVGHEHIAVPRGRKVDPGVDFPWYWFLNQLGARLAARGLR